MDIKDLKVGDKVFIKLGMQHSTKYGSDIYINIMGSGVKAVNNIYSDKSFEVIGGGRYRYTPEMVDWDKTIHLRCMENLSGVHEEEDNVKKLLSE